ncbi:Aldehyde ferredoxin oxidoreductase, C-terminal [Moorella glycerini]|uniref:Oxidoreductase YdhV n=1 Tax=Neomoorella stamsii TaxID=1266720 RepID=A0A9X7J6C2_9FIRM|nr:MULTISPECIES: aldehyde ferredoxin oxidoreductase family protein [Moorella]PRR77178.1 putative oxidoreductase YdhV [Moorella stamsii]CEP67246.1 Aldehyde ferredoxin oxidoreductase, C-terminal [Moorella glycerini]
MNDGYGGTILKIDLTTLNIEKIPMPKNLKHNFLGGNGFGIKYLYDLLPAGIDPLSPANVLIFAVGPATGTLIPTASRFAVVTKSPLTGLFIDSYAGGHWGSELKYAGYDAIVITGRAPHPVYLYINNDHVELKEATHLWGKTTYATEEIIRKDLQNHELKVAVIGPAGENKVKMASILAGTRVAARGGVGAVMGSKNLKAIAVRGTRGVKVADPEGLINFFREYMAKFKANPLTGKDRPRYGTTGGPANNNVLGILGTRNWQKETFEYATDISGPKIIDEEGRLIRSTACLACPLNCGKVLQGKLKDQEIINEGPDYETLYSFGSMCEVNSFDFILAADRLCDEYGLDTISTGVTIAFAMECFEKGLITAQDTGGLKITFGDPEIILTLIEQIAYRKGFGEILAEGSKRVSQIIGRGTEQYAMQVKGLEPAGHSARGLKGMALGYATSNRGGSHLDYRPVVERSGKADRFSPEGKGKIVKENQDMSTIGDSLVICRFTEPVFGFFLGKPYVDIVNLTTGRNLDLVELRLIAERIYTLERLFNVREGVTRAQDTLPQRFLQEPIPGGPSRGCVVRLEELRQMLDEYYQARGWDVKTGIPTKETLEKLGLE